MYAAIRILEKSLQDSMQMQQSPEADTYVNQLKLALKVLKQYQEKMEKAIEKELASETNN